MVSFEKYKKILIKRNPELTDEQILEILKFIEMIAIQTVNNEHKRVS
jgi:hypothetical protein